MHAFCEANFSLFPYFQRTVLMKLLYYDDVTVCSIFLIDEC